MNRDRLLSAWTDFLDANPDDVNSPEEYPDHALITFDQRVGIIEAASLEADEPTAAWKPIETAPKDTLVLAWCPKHHLIAMKRHGDRETETWAISPSGRMDCPEPTHWMPLPPPPHLTDLENEDG